jgi:hypothetical protein
MLFQISPEILLGWQQCLFLFVHLLKHLSALGVDSLGQDFFSLTLFLELRARLFFICLGIIT